MKLTEIEHAEVIMQIPQWRLDRWYAQTLRDVSRMLESWDRDLFDWNLGDTCTAYGGCEFAELCKIRNYENWITPEAGMFESNTWDPLHKEDVD
jgi:hypothetical protein